MMKEISQDLFKIHGQKNPLKRVKRDGCGGDDVYETLCNSGQSDCTGGPGLGAPRWVGRDSPDRGRGGRQHETLSSEPEPGL